MKPVTRYRILGPVEVDDDTGRRVAIGGPQQRAVLALLLIDRNRVVSADRLIEHLWGPEPPATARGLLQGCVAQLRRDLPAGTPLLTKAPGYSLHVRQGELDLDLFLDLEKRAETDAALWEEALALWRGPALDDLALDACRRHAARLDEMRLTVLERAIDTRLGRETDADLVGELQALVLEHPLRERFWAQLMVALYESGQRAEALAAYRRLRDALVEDLGVEPGPVVRQLHQVMLADGDAVKSYLGANRPSRADGPDPPAQLPRTSTGFVGRTDSLRRLDSLLDASGEQSAVCVVSGMAGIGKTALAVQWSRRVRARFPDGQLFAALRGYAATEPARPLEALEGFLRALGIAADRVPDELDQAAALFRSLLADRRVLLLLDDARTAEQVRPLLPGGRDNLVLVTSRDSLGGLVARDGAGHLTLDLLATSEALALLTEAIGDDRVGGEPEAADTLIDLCGRLPLALRIVAARLAMQPGRRLAAEVAELSSDERLGALQIAGDEESAVRAVFERSYAASTAEARRLFRLLGLIPLRDITVVMAAALLDAPAPVAALLLEELSQAHLVSRPAPGRFGLHDLLRLYAAERAELDESPAERDAAAYRLMLRLLADADAADRVLNPNRLRLPLPADAPPPMVEPRHGAALAWLDAECANVLTAVRYAAEHGHDRVTSLLASTIRGYLELRRLNQDWRTVGELGLAAAEAMADDRARTKAHLDLAGLHERLGRYEPAGLQIARTLVLARRTGWLEAQGVALSELGILCRHAGRLDKATGYAVAALDVARSSGWTPLIAGRLMSLGNLRAEAGDLASAAELYHEVLPLFRRIGSHSGEAIALANLGECRVALGRPEEAIDFFTAASKLNREDGNRSLAADNLRALATAHLEAGRPLVAVELAEAALSEHGATGDRRYEADSLNVLGNAHRRLDQPDRAAEYHRRALDVSRAIGVRRHEVTALIGLAQSAIRLRKPGEAREHAELSVALAEQDGLRLLEGPALTALAAALLASGDSKAAEYADRAAAVQRSTGQRLGEGRALDLRRQAAGSAESPTDPVQ